jgi:polyvinyl alcohol dehydrogenase (cytochrome)
LAGRSAAVLSFTLLACSSKTAPGKGTGAQSGDSGSPKGQSGDWTMLGHDPGSTYWNQTEKKISTTSAPNLTKAWEFDFGTGASVVATPAISGGKVYVQSQLPAVSAIDLASGKELWRNSDIGGTASPTIENGVLYINDGAGVVHALDANAGGKELWKYTPDETWIVGFSSPVLTKDYVLLGTSGLEEVTGIPSGTAQTRGYAFALHKKDGTLAWKKFTVDPPSTGVGIWSTLSVDEAAGLVVAGTGNNYTGVASDTSDAFLGMPLDQPVDGAAFLWHPQIFQGDVFPRGTGPDGDFGANPILFDVGGQKLAAGGSKKGDVWVIDRTTGSVIKQRNLGPGSSSKGGIFVNGAWDGKSLLFAANGATSTGPGSEGTGAALFALDPLTLDVNWERQIGGTAWGMISVANGVGFFGKDKTLQAFDTATGAVLLEFPTEASIATAPSVSDGYVVFGSGMSWLGSTAGTKYYALKVP